MHKALQPRDYVIRLYVSRRERDEREMRERERERERGSGLASIEDSVDASRLRLEDSVEKRGGRLITIIRNNANDTRTSGTTTTRKQKWEEKLLYGTF